MRRLIAIVGDPEAPYAAQIAAAVHVLDRGGFAFAKLSAEEGFAASGWR